MVSAEFFSSPGKYCQHEKFDLFYPHHIFSSPQVFAIPADRLVRSEFGSFLKEPPEENDAAAVAIWRQKKGYGGPYKWPKINE